MDELAQLNVILKNSFAGIKKDMSELKERQEESLSTTFKLKQDVEQIKDDYVSKDKLNALKIKVGEINESLKKIWDLDASLKNVDSRKTDKTEFEAKFSRLKEEISRKLSELNANTSKKITENSNALNKNIEIVNNNAAKIFSRINEQMKIVATKSQLRELTSDLAQEFTSVKRDVAEIKKIKDTITASELEKRTGLLNARVDLLAREVLKTNEQASKYITSEEVKSIVDAINREFDSLKSEVSEIMRLRKYISLVESELLSKKEFARNLSEVSSQIEVAKKEIREIRENSRAYARHADIEKTIRGMEALFTRKILDLEKEVMDLKRFERRHDTESFQEAKKIEKIEKFYEKPVKAETRAEPKIQRERKPLNFLPFLSIISIILIVLAFAGLAGAVISYFALEPVWTNYLTIGAVAAFVVGIVLRVIVVRKRR
jgi:uncharacterized integral membrane protein